MKPVKDQAELDEALARLDEKAQQFEKLEVEFKDVKEKLNEIRSPNYVPRFSGSTAVGTNPLAMKSLGDLTKALARNDTVGALRWSEEHYGRSKANVGTPLYSDATTGSYLITTEISSQIEYLAYQNSVLAQRVAHTPMTTRSKILPVADSMVSLSVQTAQSSALAEISPTFAQKTLVAYTAGGFVPIHESLLEDTPSDLGAYIAETFSNYLGYWLDYQIARGVTVPWNGILQDAETTVTLGAGKTSFTDAGWDDLRSMIDNLGSERYTSGGSFVFHPITVAALRTKKNANGDYLLRESLAIGGPPSFLGFPVLSCDAMPSTNAPSTAFGFFGALKNFALGDRVPMEIKKYDSTYAGAQYETILFRARCRYGGVVKIPAAFSKIRTAAA